MQSSHRKTIEATSPSISLVFPDNAPSLYVCVRKKPADNLIVLTQNPLIHAPPEFGEFADPITTQAGAAHAAVPRIFASRPSLSAATMSSNPPT